MELFIANFGTIKDVSIVCIVRKQAMFSGTFGTTAARLWHAEWKGGWGSKLHLVIGF